MSIIMYLAVPLVLCASGIAALICWPDYYFTDVGLPIA
jgi:hypothetical protein